MDRISDIVLFVHVVSSGSLSAAARKLGLSTAAVSKRLSQLEERLGAQLVNRTTRNLGPTEAGASYFERCVAIVAEIEEAEAEVGLRGAVPKGALKIIAPIAFGRLHIAPHIPEFMTHYSGVHVDLRLTARTVDFVADQCDIWIRIGEIEDSRLVARKLAPNRRVVCASPEYVKRHGEPKTPADLKGHNCLIVEVPNTRSELWHFVGPSGLVDVRVSGNLRSNDGEVITRGAAAGLGIAVKAIWDVGPMLRSGELIALVKDYAIPAADIYAVYLPSRHRSPAVRAFTSFLLEKYSAKCASWMGA
jgi:DNA-binding transcriptional LysR family regulator